MVREGGVDRQLGMMAKWTAAAPRTGTLCVTQVFPVAKAR